LLLQIYLVIHSPLHRAVWYFIALSERSAPAWHIRKLRSNLQGKSTATTAACFTDGKGQIGVWGGKDFALIKKQSEESQTTSFGNHRDLEGQEAG